MKTRTTYTTLAVVLFAALLSAVPASAQVVVGVGVSGSVVSTNPSVEIPASEPQAVLYCLDRQTGCLVATWGWDSTAVEHAGVLPAGVGAKWHRYSNIRAMRGEVSAVGTLDHEPKAATDFYYNKREKQMMMVGGRMQTRDERERYRDIIDLDSLPPGVYKDSDVARVENASRKDATYFWLFHRAGQRPNTSMPSSTSYMVARWAGCPNPTPGDVATWMVQMGCGGKPLVPLAPVRTAAVEQQPQQPAEEAPQNAANGQAGVSREGGIATDQNENNQRLAAGIAANGHNINAVNADLQQFKAWLAGMGVTSENIRAIVDYVNKLNLLVDSHETRLRVLEDWARLMVSGNGGQTTVPAATETVVPPSSDSESGISKYWFWRYDGNGASRSLHLGARVDGVRVRVSYGSGFKVKEATLPASGKAGIAITSTAQITVSVVVNGETVVENFGPAGRIGK